MYVKTVVVLKSGYNISNLRPLIKTAIQNYGNNTKPYSMGETVVANKFISIINEIEGIDYVSSIQVSADNITYTDTLAMNRLKVATFNTTKVIVNNG